MLQLMQLSLCDRAGAARAAHGVVGGRRVGSQHGVFRINGRHSAIVFVSHPLHTKSTLQIPKPSNRYTLASLSYGTPYGEVDHGARLHDPINRNAARCQLRTRNWPTGNTRSSSTAPCTLFS